MSINVRLHWAERFINFYPRETKLYLRGARGADHAKAHALEKELFDALVPFLDKLRDEAIEDCAKAVCQYVGRCNSNRCPCHHIRALKVAP